MAKILISSLGTGKKDGEYQKATYSIEQQKYTTSFVADALSQHFELDKIYLIGTKKSIWDEAYRVFGGDTDDSYYEELYLAKESGEVTKELLLQFNSIKDGLNSVIIDYGLDEDELWHNFEMFLQVAEKINDGDEVYLDITHSFRSLSLMSFVMTQFASSISEKKFKISGVFYGMLEYSRENDGVTPIVDIKLLLEIQEWIKAIDAIKKYSDFDPLVLLLNQDDNIEKSVKNTFVNLNNTINIANMSAMKQFIETAHKKITAINNTSNPIVKLLSPEILKIVDELKHEKMSDFQFALAKWFYNNKNYAQSYLALFEAVITKTCEIKEPTEDSSLENVRNNIKGRLDTPYNKIFLENKDKKNENLDSISSIRHSIAHQLNNRKDKVNQDIEKLSFFIKKFESYFAK